MSLSVQYRRPDGTFIILLNGQRYHVVPGDPRFEDAQVLGANAPFEPAPEPLPVEPPVLSKMQWGAFLDMTGFRAAADAALSAMPKDTPENVRKWALMKNVIAESAYYRRETALALVAHVRAAFPGLSLPTDQEVLAAWTIAADLSVQNLLD